MAKEREKDSGFKVSDRRMFNEDGELRRETEEETPAASEPKEESRAAVAEAPLAEAPGADQAASSNMPAPPSDAEQKAQHDAYRQSAKDLDARVELSGHSAKELEINFERFMASLYMTAMLQLGLMHEQGGQPQVDLIGARQTIDTLGMLSEKTKGNLTPKEQSFLQNCLYELRMAYVEVTNALARPPQPGPSTGTNG
jgi:hypothetical protein